MLEMAAKKFTGKVDRGIQRVRRPPNPFCSACKHITSPQFIPNDTEIINAKTGPVTKFAFISFDPFDPSDFDDDFIPLCGQCKEGIGTAMCRNEAQNSSLQKRRNCHRGLDADSCYRRLLRRTRARRAKSLRHYKNALTEAFAVTGVNIVVVNELGIPASPTGPSAEFFGRMKSWAKTESSLIIAGSYHDARTKYNTGYVFTPESPDVGYAFHKQVSATDAGEYISVPSERKSMVVQAFGYKIGVIICLDLLDYSTVVSLVEMRDTIDFILVPSYVEPENMLSLQKVARSASQAMPGGVGIVNCHHGKTRSSTMHMFGKLLVPILDRALTDESGWLSVYEIDFDWFRAEKRKAQDDILPDLEWLYLFPTISRA